jgi:uncharacterized membrane protein YgdD (TMEM256/DUF423 family)
MTRGRLSPEMMAVFQTGCIDARRAGDILVAGIMGHMSGWLIQTAGWCFVAGIVFFSGSLHLLAVTGVTVLGAITPIGGLLFPAGRARLALRGDLKVGHVVGRKVLSKSESKVGVVGFFSLIRITDTITIEDRELTSIVRVGPGGQNVKVSTAVERARVRASSLPPDMKQRLMTLAGSRGPATTCC